jgi:hypothetical protein
MLNGLKGGILPEGRTLAKQKVPLVVDKIVNRIR